MCGDNLIGPKSPNLQYQHQLYPTMRPHAEGVLPSGCHAVTPNSHPLIYDTLTTRREHRALTYPSLPNGNQTFLETISKECFANLSNDSSKPVQIVNFNLNVFPPHSGRNSWFGPTTEVPANPMIPLHLNAQVQQMPSVVQTLNKTRSSMNASVGPKITNNLPDVNSSVNTQMTASFEQTRNVSLTPMSVQSFTPNEQMSKSDFNPDPRHGYFIEQVNANTQNVKNVPTIPPQLNPQSQWNNSLVQYQFDTKTQNTYFMQTPASQSYQNYCPLPQPRTDFFPEEVQPKALPPPYFGKHPTVSECQQVKNNLPENKLGKEQFSSYIPSKFCDLMDNIIDISSNRNTKEMDVEKSSYDIFNLRSKENFRNQDNHMKLHTKLSGNHCEEMSPKSILTILSDEQLQKDYSLAKNEKQDYPSDSNEQFDPGKKTEKVSLEPSKDYTEWNNNLDSDMTVSEKQNRLVDYKSSTLNALSSTTKIENECNVIINNTKSEVTDVKCNGSSKTCVDLFGQAQFNGMVKDDRKRDNKAEKKKTEKGNKKKSTKRKGFEGINEHSNTEKKKMKRQDSPMKDVKVLSSLDSYSSSSSLGKFKDYTEWINFMENGHASDNKRNVVKTEGKEKNLSKDCIDDNISYSTVKDELNDVILIDDDEDVEVLTSGEETFKSCLGLNINIPRPFQFNQKGNTQLKLEEQVEKKTNRNETLPEIENAESVKRFVERKINGIFNECHNDLIATKSLRNATPQTENAKLEEHISEMDIKENVDVEDSSVEDTMLSDINVLKEGVRKIAGRPMEDAEVDGIISKILTHENASKSTEELTTLILTLINN